MPIPAIRIIKPTAERNFGRFGDAVEVPSLTDEVGHAQLLLSSPDGRFEAAADPRSDGGAAAR